MQKKILSLLLIISIVIFSGCCKTNKKTITGVEKILIATEKMTPHTVELIEARMIKLQLEIDNAQTEEDKSFWKALLTKEKSYLLSNQKLPEALRKLLKALKE